MNAQWSFKPNKKMVINTQNVSLTVQETRCKLKGTKHNVTLKIFLCELIVTNRISVAKQNNKK